MKPTKEIEDLKEQVQELDNEKGELLSEIVTLQDTIDELRDVFKLTPFPDSFYTSASDCLQHHDATGKPLTELERQLLIYASELEEIIGEIEDALS